MSLFLMESHIVASVGRCSVVLSTACLVISKFITVDDLGLRHDLSCMPLYAMTAVDNCIAHVVTLQCCEAPCNILSLYGVYTAETISLL